MADTETKPKAEKQPQKSDKAPRPEKGDKAQQAQKGPKPEKGDKAAKGEAPPPKPRRREERVTPRLKTYFEDVVRKKLADEFGYKSRLQVPVIEKVVINMGIGEGVADRRKVEAAANDLGLIAGQKAVITKARKSIATFKVRDTIGIKEHIIFPEIDYDKVADVWGMDITVCTSAKTDNEARALLSAFNFPFRQ